MGRSSLLSYAFLCLALAACGSSGGDDDGTSPEGDGSAPDGTSGNVDGAGGDGSPSHADANGGPDGATGDDGATGSDGSGGGDSEGQGDAGGDDANDAAGPTDANGANDASDSAVTTDASDAASAVDASDANASCGPCDTPPDSCHAKLGTCENGQCAYAFVNGATCDDGDPCTVDDTCGNGTCAGIAMVCDTPPAPVCLSGTQSITHDAQGTCNGGLCVYTSHTTTCPSGPCQNGVCTTDPCSGITCDTPPSVCYTSAGQCSGGSCTYPYADGTSCNDGNACTTGDSCNTGECKGVPLACDTPPASTCVNPSTLKAYVSSGTCTLGSCSYTYSFIDCPAGCANDQCTASGWTGMTSNTTENLWAVWGSSANAIWAVGADGTAVFYNGTQWQVRPVPSQAESGLIFAIHGSAANDVYAVAQTALIHFDGTSWKFVVDLNSAVCELTTGVYATGDANDDVYVSCWYSVDTGEEFIDTDTLYEVTGAGVITQVTQTSGNIGCVGYAGGVWAFSPTNVWMGGCPPVAWNGATAAAIGTSPPSSPQIWAASPTAVFTIDYNENQDGTNVVQLWNGSVWAPLNTGVNGTISAISGSSATRVFAAGYDAAETSGVVVYYDGTGFTNQTLPASTTKLQGIRAAPTGQVFAVGENGTVVTGP